MLVIPHLMRDPEKTRFRIKSGMTNARLDKNKILIGLEVIDVQ